MNRPLIACVVMAAACTCTQASIIGPSSYTSSADSPFFNAGLATFSLEDFEDGLLNTPGVSASAGTPLAFGALRDSVDADDAVIDGSGSAGTSWYSNGLRSVSFTFDESVLGALPTHAGIVWTDVGFTDTLFCIGDVVFEAFDQNGISLGSIGPVTLGDGQADGGSAEDRFFGAVNLGGISSITLSMPQSGDWEMDHLQFGSVPSPGAVALLVAAMSAARARRR